MYIHPEYYRPLRTGDVQPIRNDRAGMPCLSIHEQLGVDPQSKLAAAINRLCDLLDGIRD